MRGCGFVLTCRFPLRVYWMVVDFFCSCDLDQMTFIYELRTPWRYTGCSNMSTSRLSKVIGSQTDRHKYTASQKNCATIHSFITLTNVGQFSKFFHCCIHQWHQTTQLGSASRGQSAILVGQRIWEQVSL